MAALFLQVLTHGGNMVPMAVEAILTFTVIHTGTGSNLAPI